MHPAPEPRPAGRPSEVDPLAVFHAQSARYFDREFRQSAPILLHNLGMAVMSPLLREGWEEAQEAHAETLQPLMQRYRSLVEEIARYLADDSPNAFGLSRITDSALELLTRARDAFDEVVDTWLLTTRTTYYPSPIPFTDEINLEEEFATPVPEATNSAARLVDQVRGGFDRLTDAFLSFAPERLAPVDGGYDVERMIHLLEASAGPLDPHVDCSWNIQKGGPTFFEFLHSVVIALGEARDHAYEEVQRQLLQHGRLFAEDPRTADEHPLFSGLHEALFDPAPLRITNTADDSLLVSVELASGLRPLLRGHLSDLRGLAVAAAAVLSNGICVREPRLVDVGTGSDDGSTVRSETVRLEVEIALPEVRSIPLDTDTSGADSLDAFSPPLLVKFLHESPASPVPHLVEVEVERAALSTPAARETLWRSLQLCDEITAAVPEITHCSIYAAKRGFENRITRQFEEQQCTLFFSGPIVRQSAAEEKEDPRESYFARLAEFRMLHGWSCPPPDDIVRSNEDVYLKFGGSFTAFNNQEARDTLARVLARAVPLQLMSLPEPDAHGQVDTWRFDDLCRVLDSVQSVVGEGRRLGVEVLEYERTDLESNDRYRVSVFEVQPDSLQLVAAGHLPVDRERISFRLISPAVVTAATTAATELLETLALDEGAVIRVSALDRALMTKGVLLSDQLLLALTEIARKRRTDQTAVIPGQVVDLMNRFAERKDVVITQTGPYQVMLLQSEAPTALRALKQERLS